MLDVRVMTYNVHSCIGVDGKHSLERIAAVIEGAATDVVCLQELDLQRPRTGGVEQARILAEMLGMESQFHPTIRRDPEQYGDAILSKKPMRLIRARPFPEVPRPVPREPRGAIWVEIMAGDVTWQLMNTHFGLGRDERRLQAAELAENWMHPASEKPPVVVCGDFNSRPSSFVHQILARKAMDAFRVKGLPHPATFSTRFAFVCLDYLFVSPDVVVRDVSAVVTPMSKLASDHFPVIADLEQTRIREVGEGR
ncbi:MAG TPA: endonuclease/exonuclease/phosphatase family protein [Chthoniobacterales bacterium]